ncbi:UDP-3-O-(3-hydroxymyristoyl)glucosamine N-acyltransferase [Paralimibaculum aggregatum]|uniref:UDP-3-O-acylglucosamine N-acyltransferase n=1 Tax=Paralimibaculum aggregatum TaxID=3036245 RepID=A0ABQ6LLG4_9RHOB|nr:UDP-3-O-(3-hydroxymyristoyl)glucosamine N-acyltransferase [Limibaculum sp. NKW23]GMG84047.1 UDP-3-O-(3-hydroxymyristoyl)glucosamine N-acyltransferase [Limibaculum sp. NKW23]
MPHSVRDIARLTGLVAEGALDLEVERPAEPQDAGPRDLALAMSEDYAAAVKAGQARAAILWEGADWRALGLEAALFAPRARVALAAVGEMFAPEPEIAAGIHPTALVDASARIGADVGIGAYAIIGAGAEIGDGCRIGAHASLARGTRLGAGSRLADGVRIGLGVTIGERAIVQANAVIGADGFSYVTPERGSVESAKREGRIEDDARNTQGLRRIASLGGVEIGNDVEIGAGTCIDAGTIAPTRIGHGTKIDNLVQVGHNCQIGASCMICGHVGLAGSVKVGDRAVLGGKVGVGDHLEIGEDAVLAGGSLVGSNIPARSISVGVPAVPRDQFFRREMAQRRLPKLVEQVREIRAKLGL